MQCSQTKNWFISHDDVFKASKTMLVEYANSLSDYGIKLEQFFEQFLSKARLKDNDLDHPDWKVYRVMLDESERVDELLTSIKYFQSQAKNWNV